MSIFILRRLCKYFSFVFFLAIIIYYQISWLGVYHEEYNLNKDTVQSEEFRALNVSENGLNTIIKFANKNNLQLDDCISVIMVVYDYDLCEYNSKEYTINDYKRDYIQIKKHYNSEFNLLKKAYAQIIGGLTYFPVPNKNNNIEEIINYSNSWGAERTYGGERRHEGTDIMDINNKRGTLPVLSMTDGKVVNLGWLELGGYRVGIKSNYDGYFYYAHLYSYAEGLKEGDKVYAGQLIGFMGDSGYSKVEGTTGKFDVHLHVGIYLELENGGELSVNPYFILKNLEQNNVEYDY